MIARLLFVALAALGVCSGASLRPREGLSPASLDVPLTEAAAIYHTIGENIRLTGPHGKGGNAVISSYKAIVQKGGALPAPSGRNFSQPTQFALCGAETTLYVGSFTGSQVSEIRKLLTKDKKSDKVFTPSFAAYVPICADAINANGKVTQASYAAAIDIYSG